MKRRSMLALFAGLLVLGMPGAVAGQEESEGGEFFDVLDVHVVNVEVYVTDRRGVPITGLSREDFELFEDGRPMTITHFHAFEGEEAREGHEGPQRPRAMPAHPGMTEAETAVPTGQRLYLVVYVDNFNIRPFNRNRVSRRLREFLNTHLQEGDRVMLVTYDRTFNERIPFTSDPALVNNALFEIERVSGHAVHQDSDRREALEFVDNARGATEALVRVRTYAGSLHNDLMFTIDALRDMVNNLGGLPGRKALLYVSDGLPMTPGEDLFIAISEKFQASSVLMEAREFDASRRFQELAAQANSHQVTFYTIDAAGLRSYTTASVDRTSPAISTLVDSQYIHNLQWPLLRLAEATGGRAIINTNDVAPGLDEIGRDLRAYYSLGFQPAHTTSGRYHRIEVKVGQRGARVRHREGYRAKSVEQRMEEGVMAALRFDEHANPGGVEMSIGEHQRRSDGYYLVPVQVRFPLDRVTLVPLRDDTLHRARLKLYLAALDSDGGIAPVQSTEIPVEVPAEGLVEAREKSWGYDLTLLMRSGSHRLAVGLRDELGAESSFLAKGFRVGT